MQNKLKISLNDEGKPILVHINRGTQDNPMWAALPFVAESKKFISRNKTDKMLLEEAQLLDEWKDLDLSDRSISSATNSPNWQGVLDGIRGTEFFGKVYLLSESSTEVQTAYTTISIALNSARPKLEDLYFGLLKLQEKMGDNMNKTDIDNVNQILKDNNFDFQLK